MRISINVLVRFLVTGGRGQQCDNIRFVAADLFKVLLGRKYRLSTIPLCDLRIIMKYLWIIIRTHTFDVRTASSGWRIGMDVIKQNSNTHLRGLVEEKSK